MNPVRKNQGAARYRQAAAVYIGVGVPVIIITLFTPGLTSPSRYSEVARLFFAVPFFLLFGFLIYKGDQVFAALARRLGTPHERSERIGAWVQEKLAMLLTLSALGRTFVFASNTVGWQPEIHYTPPAFHLHPIDPLPLMTVNAGLMTIIVVVLARASWVPFVRRRLNTRRLG